MTLTPRPPARTGRSLWGPSPSSSGSRSSSRPDGIVLSCGLRCRGAIRAAGGTIPPVKRAAVVLALIAIGVAGVVWLQPSRSAARPLASAGPSSVAASPRGSSLPASSGGGSASPVAPSPSPPPTGATVAVQIVPVTQFRSTALAVTRADVAAALAGTSRTFDALEIVAADADAILGTLKLDRPADASKLVEAAD